MPASGELMRYRIVYQHAEDASKRRDLVVDAADEGGAYDRALEEMGEDEILVEVSPLPSP
jgi:hypothetical protein